VDFVRSVGGNVRREKIDFQKSSGSRTFSGGGKFLSGTLKSCEKNLETSELTCESQENLRCLK
jgi:hypothetical protein